MAGVGLVQHWEGAIQVIRPGDTVWIPAGDVEAFVREVLELKDCDVSYSAEAGAWSVRYPEWSARQNVKVTQELGTSRMNAIELVLAALNVQVPTVRDRDPETDRYFVNPDETLAACKASNAILLAAVGGPKWDDPAAKTRPEAGLLKLRKELGLFANLRPIFVSPHLVSASPLKTDIVSGTDILFFRELTGGIYFGPSGKIGRAHV
mgnify:CR=1 FL=1